MSISVEFDWVEVPRSTDVFAQSTMAAFAIEVNGRSVTSVLDRRSTATGPEALPSIEMRPPTPRVQDTESQLSRNRGVVKSAPCLA